MAAYDSANVRQLAESLIDERAASGRPLTIAAFARTAAINRATLYAAFPDIVARLNAARETGSTQSSGRTRDERTSELQNGLKIARRQRDDARRLLSEYAHQIQMLSLRVDELTEALEGLADVPRIGQGEHVRSEIPKGRS